MFPKPLAWATLVIGATLLTPLVLRLHPFARVAGRKRPVADLPRPRQVRSSRYEYLGARGRTCGSGQAT